jgi:hypothetical protein
MKKPGKHYKQLNAEKRATIMLMKREVRCWASFHSAQPCIFLSMVVSHHHTKQRKLEPNLKTLPCNVDQALCFTFRQHRTEQYSKDEPCMHKASG